MSAGYRKIHVKHAQTQQVLQKQSHMKFITPVAEENAKERRKIPSAIVLLDEWMSKLLEFL